MATLIYALNWKSSPNSEPDPGRTRALSARPATVHRHAPTAPAQPPGHPSLPAQTHPSQEDPMHPQQPPIPDPSLNPADHERLLRDAHERAHDPHPDRLRDPDLHG